MLKEVFDCEEAGCKTISNVHEEYAEAMHKALAKNACRSGYVIGKIRLAVWSPISVKAPTPLYYLYSLSGAEAAVRDIQCARKIVSRPK